MSKGLQIFIVIIAILILEEKAIVIGLASGLAAIVYNWVKSKIEDR